jgi:hypothetical protein
VRTLESEWRDFESACGLDGPGVGEVQRAEMRRAFFAGAYVLATQALGHGTDRIRALGDEAERACCELISPEIARGMLRSLAEVMRAAKGGRP